ncbi:hypothetical protein [Microvirga puerhi]|uniref:Uncharacterized protein n=1 Tax=Microvirga puerhi TaxID=2876078 RepID=A0ABS7VMM4_9HYPH|nr:hypothetical protein [Microvirga puerhi]MBZ6076390.1 hypothetical protein [Microvirga puerhi]
MLTWAGLVALVVGALTYLSGDVVAVLRGAAELGAVTAMFALVCAFEAFN